MSFSADVPADQIPAWWQSFIDINEDVKPYLQFTGQGTGPDVILQLLTDNACQWIQDYLGRPLAPTTFFRRFSGWSTWNGSFIELPYYPVLQITKLVEYWGLNGEHQLVYQTPAQQGGPGDELYQVDWLQGHLIRTYQGLIQRPFFPGSNNIECTWVAGYNPVPAHARTAALELVAYWWRNTQESPRWFQAANDEYGAGANPMWQAVPNRVTQLLQPLTQVGIG